MRFPHCFRPLDIHIDISVSKCRPGLLLFLTIFFFISTYINAISHIPMICNRKT